MQPDRAQAEHIAQHHHRELHQHHGQRRPGRRPADRGVQAIDAVGKREHWGAGDMLYIRRKSEPVRPPWPEKTTITTTKVTHDHHHDHDHGSELSETQLRVRALETILTEKGYVDPAALDAMIETYETKIGPRNGARVDRQGLDRSRLQAGAARRMPRKAIADARPCRPRRRASRGGREHADDAQHGRLHAVLLLSVGMLGLPPVWYKAAPYRSRAVMDPRGVLARFRRRRCRRTPRSGSGIRPPRRAFSWCRCGPPAPKAGARSSSPTLVTRDSMIGTGLPKQPKDDGR